MESWSELIVRVELELQKAEERHVKFIERQWRECMADPDYRTSLNLYGRLGGEIGKSLG